MRDVLVGSIFVFTAVPAVIRPWLGVLLWTWLDYMSPHMLCYGFALRVPWVLIAAAVTALSMFLSPERLRLPLRCETLLLIGFCIWMTITTVFALNQQETWPYWSRVIKIQVFIFATLLVMRTPVRINQMVWVIAGSIGYYGLRGGLGSLFSGGANRIYGPDGTFIGDNNDLALALVTIIPLLRYLQLRAERQLVRYAAGGTIGLTVLAILTSYSRAGLLGLSAVVLFLLFKSRRRILFTLAIAGLLIACFRFMPEKWFARMSTIQDYQEDNSAQERLNSWKTAWRLALDRPIVGGGFRAFTPELYERYNTTPDYHEAHSIFLKILAEQGFPGLFLFLSLGVCTWRSATWVRHASRGDPSLLWASDLVSMTQVALVGYAVGGAFSNLAYFDLPYNLMAIVVLCKVWISEKASDVTEAVSENAWQHLTPA